jgi:hypothetical protein
MSSVEFFRPESQRPLDAGGFELPEWENPFFAIPDQGEPTADDVAWLNENPTLPPIRGGSPEPFEPSAADWDDYARWSEWQDRLENVHCLNRITDEDIAATGLAVG